MLSIGNLVLGKAPRTAASFTDKVPYLSIQAAKRAGLDIAELRIDLFSSFLPQHLLSEAAKFRRVLPVLATIRSHKEGGRWAKSERVRRDLYKILIPAVDAVDIELSSKNILKQVVWEARRHKKTVIVSYHNFSKTPSPSELLQIVLRAKSAGADIVKIAAHASCKKDVRTLADFTLAHRKASLVTIAMGETGKISRTVFPALGSLFTFAHLGNSSAPGQMDLKTTVLKLKQLKTPVHLSSLLS